MKKTGVHGISKNINYRRERFKRLKILEKDQGQEVFNIICLLLARQDTG